MTPYIATKIPAEHLLLWQKIKEAILHLPDLDLGDTITGEKIILSCHMLARAIGKIFNLKVVDGHFDHGFAHSWLLTSDKEWVIDVYPVGIIGGPLIADATGPLTPGRRLYTKGGRICKKISFSSPDFKRSMRKIIKEIRKNTPL